MTSKVEIYEDARGEYRWRMKASNGRIVATGGEGFTRKSSCRESVDGVWDTFNADDVEIVELEADGE
jgi:uncharacterized protein YegP (UPF0339 family)